MITVQIPGKTSILAVKIEDTYGLGGSLGTLSDGRVTDSSWKCTDTAPGVNWASPTFDDSNWPPALASYPNFHITSLASNAKWIWAGSNYGAGYRKRDATVTVYCRKKL